MKKFLGVSLLVAGAVGSIAGAQSFDQYVSAKGSVLLLENKFSGTGVYRNKESIHNNFSKNKTKTVGGLRLAYGLAFPVGENAIRTEIEYGYNGKAKLNGTVKDYAISVNPMYPKADVPYRSEIKSQFLMANIYYDFNTGTKLTPYVGAGLGYARVKASNSASFAGNNYGMSNSSNNFAWNLSVGVGYEINKNLTFDASYRYADYGDVKTSGNFKIAGQKYTQSFNTKSKVRSNEFNLGFRYTF